MFSCERIDSWEDAENFKGWADTGHVKLKDGTLKAEILALCSLSKLLLTKRSRIPTGTKTDQARQIITIAIHYTYTKSCNGPGHATAGKYDGP